MILRARPLERWLGEAARLLMREAGWAGDDVERHAADLDGDVLRAAYRDAARRHHPDAGRDGDTFRRIQQAKDTLDRYLAIAS